MNWLIQKLLLQLSVLLLLLRLLLSLCKVLHAILSQKFEQQHLSLLLLSHVLWRLIGARGAARRPLVEDLSRTEVLVLLSATVRVHVQVLMRVICSSGSQWIRSALSELVQFFKSLWSHAAIRRVVVYRKLISVLYEKAFEEAISNQKWPFFCESALSASTKSNSESLLTFAVMLKLHLICSSSAFHHLGSHICETAWFGCVWRRLIPPSSICLRTAIIANAGWVSAVFHVQSLFNGRRLLYSGRRNTALIQYGATCTIAGSYLLQTCLIIWVLTVRIFLGCHNAFLNSKSLFLVND